uniref:Genome polyprotein n=1 Tax=Norway rat hepacivirus 1 TaxID=1562038 RepID=A0A221I0Z3_9FLAV|nr:polyprotein [Norway rat hepacivirus 1]
MACNLFFNFPSTKKNQTKSVLHLWWNLCVCVCGVVMSKPVRPGQYIVTTKRRSDPGAKRRRRHRRDQGGWRRSPMGPVDPYVRQGLQILLPSAAYPVRDPRRKSRFLGHIIDGTLGWTADLLHHVPLVGPLVGHPARLICRAVRACEDGINSFTGIAGVHLFLICWAHMLSPASAGIFPLLPGPLDELATSAFGTFARLSYDLLTATRETPTVSPTVPSVNGQRSYPQLVPLTNCCNHSQVSYCTELSCMHDTGCVICEQVGNTSLCWVPQGPMVSRSPHYQGADPFLAHHIDFVAGMIYMCDLAAMHELCGAMVLLARAGIATVPVAIQLNTTADCYLEVQSGVDPSILGWVGWLKDEFVSVTALFSFVSKIPSALAFAFGKSHYITLAAICGLALNGHVPKAVALTVLYVEAAVAAPVSTPALDCPWNAQPPSCNFSAEWTNLACYGQKGPFLPPSVARFASDIIGTLVANGVNTSRAKEAVTSRKAYHVGGFGCIGTLRGNRTCCSLRRVPSLCNACASDCSWMGKELTYERCGTTPWLTTGCDLQNGSCRGEVLAGFNLPATFPPGGVQWTTIRFQDGHPVLVWYKVWDKPASQWARLPGTPEQFRGSWMKVPKGYYSSRRDLSTGLISKDSNYPDYQLFYSASGSLQVAGITTHLVIVACLAALGARWCLVAYALFNSMLPVGALEVVKAATAASTHDLWIVRAVIYIVCLRWSMLAKLLTKQSCFFILLSLADVVEAYEGGELRFAGALVIFATLLSGLLSTLVPRLVLTLSYLRWRLRFFGIYLADRRIVLLGVLFAPNAVAFCCWTFWFCYLGLVCLQQVVVHCLGIRTRQGFFTTIRKMEGSANWLRRSLLKVAIWAGAEEGNFWYNHLHGDLRINWQFQDPYFPFQTEVETAEDTGFKLACGDTLKGLPVYARLGKTVRAGISSLPRGWRFTAPFNLRTVQNRRELSHLALCLTGHDSAVYNGSICVIGTPLSRFMGFGCNGVLYTAAHGTNGRHLALDGGSRPPIVYDKVKDFATYPLPKGMKCLEAGSCSCTEFYLATRLGNLVPCVKIDGSYVNTTPLTLKEAKGSSGAPIICKCRYVHAIFLRCRSSKGVVSSLTGLPIDSAKVGAQIPEAADLGKLPPVLKEEQSIRMIVAPTGSGKSTRIPMEYYKQGYKVLVLNPSVATTLNFEEYMAKQYGVRPNIHCGDTHHDNGSRLTYMTYGMFLAKNLLDADVIICDECHAVDATTVLGIGAALHKFENSPVAKLLLLATATPPGTPVTPHPNVETIDLDQDGEIPFHGKKIKIGNIQKGRHLIFQTSKSHCDNLANDLRAAGLNAVSYYRGKDISCIPSSGDCVVVATDALMTGYTGNFDSVYDCCLMVEPTLEVDMMPTFKLGLRTKAADSIAKMQRRGRTGRGKPGTYYQVCPQADTSGIVPDACIYEAFDSGLAYFGRTPAEVATHLSFYHNQVGLPTIKVIIPEVQAIFMQIGYVQSNYLEMMKNRVDSYTYLYAAQYQLAKAEGAMAPNDNPAWRGLSGKAKFPLLYHLEEYDLDKVQAHSIASSIQGCYEEYFAETVMTLAGVGLAVSCVFMAIDLFGNCAILRAWDLTGDSSAALNPAPEMSILEEVEECSTQWGSEALAEGAQRAAQWLGDKMTELGGKLGGKTALERKITEFLPHILAGVQYFAGLTCLREAPGVGAVLGFVGSSLSPLPLKVNLFLSALGGAFATKLTTQTGAAVFGAAGAIGALVGAANLGAMVGHAFLTYGSATSACLVVLKLIDGQWPDFSEWASLAMSVASPGSFIVGAGAAIMVAFCTRSESQVWMNRLLAMLHRGTSCDEYFVQATTLRQTIIKWLETASIWSAFRQLADWIMRADEDVCTSPRAAWAAFMMAVGGICRTLVEMARGVCRHLFKIPGCPLYACRPGYKGPWKGSGMVKSTCECGTEGLWNISEGKAIYVSSTAWCRCWWSGGVPVNNSFTGVPRPAPVGWTSMAVRDGYSAYCVYERRGEDIYLVGVSYPGQVVDAGVPDFSAAVAVDGVQVKPFGGTDWRKCHKFAVRYGSDNEEKQLPLKVSGSPPPKEEKKAAKAGLLAEEIPLRRLCRDVDNRAIGLSKRKSRAVRDCVDLPYDTEETSFVTFGAPKPSAPSCDTDSMLTAGTYDVVDMCTHERHLTYCGDCQRPIAEEYETAPSSVQSVPPTVVTRSTASKASRAPSPARQIITKVGVNNPAFLWDEVEGRPAPITPPPEAFRVRTPPRLEIPMELLREYETSNDHVPKEDSWNQQVVVAEVHPVPESISDGSSWTTSSSLDPDAPEFTPDPPMSGLPEVVPLPSQSPVRQPKPKPLKIKGKVRLAKGAKPLPKTKPTDPDTFSLHSSSWETQSSGSWTDCSWSYSWSVPQLVYKGFQRVRAAIHTYTFGLMRNPNLVYSTTHASANERVRKVTIQRTREETPELRYQIAMARARVQTLMASELTLEEALSLTSNTTAKSAVTGMTAKDLKSGKTEIVKTLYSKLEEGIQSPWNQVCVMPKIETFVETPEKKSHKPARLIAYPHLEMRVVEKMVLGQIGPKTVKAVCGDAYGFVTPQERVQKLVTMWQSKQKPAGFTCDTVCFDSTITPADVAVESSLYEAATTDERTRRRIRSLHDNLYAGGPMVMQGAEVGYRRCRASGVFTTSSSNTMTCFLKVSAAAKAAGIASPSWLICGDDTVCIFESGGEETDKQKCAQFAVAMKRMGAPQGEVPKPYYHLELLDSCSSNVSSANTKLGLYYYMTRDPRIPLARSSIEGKGYNPLGTWLGYILANYPAVWVCRVLCVQFLQQLLTQESVKEITFDWYGNNYKIPVAKIPYIIESLHGKQCWQIQAYTPREIQRVSQALHDNTIRPLRYYKRAARQVFAACMQRKGTLRFLAKTLLWWVHQVKVELDPRKVAMVKEFSPYDPYSNPNTLEDKPSINWMYLGMGIIALCALCLANFKIW